jgi:hypothetical protein
MASGSVGTSEITVRTSDTEKTLPKMLLILACTSQETAAYAKGSTEKLR